MAVFNDAGSCEGGMVGARRETQRSSALHDLTLFSSYFRGSKRRRSKPEQTRASIQVFAQWSIGILGNLNTAPAGKSVDTRLSSSSSSSSHKGQVSTVTNNLARLSGRPRT